MHPKHKLIRLYDTYRALLTDHQQQILHLYLEEDWSYGEIAEREGVSRAAIYDLIRRARALLDAHEARLHLLARERRLTSSLTRLRIRLQQLEREMVSIRRALQRLA
jgi:predicted DNA-binding protein YlxM (UPF0122 family)